MSDIYSSHIFMFPFRFDYISDTIDDKFDFYEKKSIEDRVDFDKLFKKLKSSGWNYEKFDIYIDDKEHPNYDNRHLNYNEYAYFYDYARDALYNLGDSPKEVAISNYFSKKIENTNATFMIHIKNITEDKSSCENYTLNIAGIDLRIFHTGVAILSIELENRAYKNFDDILKINDYGRRIYPQFYGKDMNLQDTKNTFLADYIAIKYDNIDTVEHFGRSNDSKNNSITIGNHIMKILGDCFTQEKSDKDKFYIQPSLDDRMFVLSWYGNDELSTNLTNCLAYKESDEWYKYVFVDNGDVTVKNTQMKKELLKDATYDRWSGNKILYGITRYSFMCLTDKGWFPANIIQPHMKTMYFQMATLLLATRTSIIRFSDEVAAVATSKNKERLQPLYEKYLTFYNRLYFKEVTHQDQGIELYNMARKQMYIDEHIEKLDNKFTKLFEYAKLKSDEEQSESMDRLSIMGAVFLPPSIMIALFSMGIFDYNKSEETLSSGLFFIFLSAGVAYLLFKLTSIKKFNLLKILTWLIPILIIFVFYIYSAMSFYYIQDKNNTKFNVIETITKIMKKEVKNDSNKTK